MKNPNKICLIISILLLMIGLWNLLGIGDILSGGGFDDFDVAKMLRAGFLSLIGSIGLLFQLYFHNIKE